MRNTTDRVLVLGWRNTLLEAARQRGLAVTAVYGPVEKKWTNPDLSLAQDAVFVDDPHDIERVLAGLARADLLAARYRGVCAASEDFITSSAVLARILGSHGLSLQTALACRDKSIQKSRIRAAGLPVAASTVLADLADLAEGGAIPPGIEFPVVLKPVGGVGVTHTFIVEDARRLADVAARLADGNVRTFIAEEFIAGDEWEMDAVIGGGRVAFLSLARYGDPLIRVQEGKIVRSIVRDPEHDTEDYARARPFAQAAVDALGIVDGVIHLEAFRRTGSGEFVFGECAVRPGGSWVCELVAAKFGVDLHAAHLEASCGILKEPVPRTNPGYFGMAQFPAIEGVLDSCRTETELAARPNVVLADVRARPGRRMRSGTETVNARLGGMVVSGRTPDEVEKTITDTVDWFMSGVVVRP